MKKSSIKNLIPSFAIKKLLGLAMMIILSTSLTANAALLSYDGFVAGDSNAEGEYIANPGTSTAGRYFFTTGQDPLISGYTGSWASQGGAQYELGASPISSLFYNDGTDTLATSGNTTFRSFTSGQSTRALDNTVLGLGVDGNTRYFSYMMKLDDVTALGQIDFGYTAFSSSGAMRIRTDGSNFIASLGFASTTLMATDTDVHLFVWKVTYGSSTNEMELYVDPILDSESSNTAAATQLVNTAFGIQSYLTLTRGTTGGTSGNGVLFDELRIGESWADVLPVPEPSSLALVAMMTGVGLMRRRRQPKSSV